MWHLGLKLAALFSFCGGPLALADWLKVQIDKDLAFAIALSPIVGLIFGAWSLHSGDPTRWDRWMVALGCASVVVLFGMNLFGLWWLSIDPDRPDGGLIALGIAVGTLYSAYYLRASHRFFGLRFPGSTLER